MIARYVLILRHPDGRLEPYVHDADAEVFGVSSRVTIEGRCWHVQLGSSLLSVLRQSLAILAA